MKLILIRHGESLGNVDHDEYLRTPDANIVLSENGEKQAIDCGFTLFFKKSIGKFPLLFITSPYKRARQTKDLILRSQTHGCVISEEEDALLRERAWGNLRQLREDFKKSESKGDGDFNKFFDFFFKPDGGESFAECQDRANLFLTKLKIRAIVGELDNDTAIVVVCHGEFIRCLLAAIDKVTLKEFYKTARIKNCEIQIRKI